MANIMPQSSSVYSCQHYELQFKAAYDVFLDNLDTHSGRYTTSLTTHLNAQDLDILFGRTIQLKWGVVSDSWQLATVVNLLLWLNLQSSIQVGNSSKRNSTIWKEITTWKLTL